MLCIGPQATLIQILCDALYDPRIDPLVPREIRNIPERRIREIGGRAAAPALPAAALGDEKDGEIVFTHADFTRSGANQQNVKTLCEAAVRR